MRFKPFRSLSRRGAARTGSPPQLKWRGKHWPDDDQTSYPGGVAGAVGCSPARKPGG